LDVSKAHRKKDRSKEVKTKAASTEQKKQAGADTELADMVEPGNRKRLEQGKET